MDVRNCQTLTATPAEPGELPGELGGGQENPGCSAGNGLSTGFGRTVLFAYSEAAVRGKAPQAQNCANCPQLYARRSSSC